MAEVEKLSLYKLKEYKWRWKIMEHSTSKSHFMDIYWLITKAKFTMYFTCGKSAWRLWRTRFYKYSFFIKLITCSVDLFFKQSIGVNKFIMMFFVFFEKKHIPMPSLVDFLLLMLLSYPQTHVAFTSSLHSHPFLSLWNSNLVA